MLPAQLTTPVVVQRAAERAEPPAAAAEPAAAADAPAPATGQQPSDRELDALAHQLYDRLRSRLRMELLVDRERAGLVTDLR